MLDIKFIRENKDIAQKGAREKQVLQLFLELIHTFILLQHN
jgi:seryl-tRNA synthetase